MESQIEFSMRYLVTVISESEIDALKQEIFDALNKMNHRWHGVVIDKIVQKERTIWERKNG